MSGGMRSALLLLVSSLSLIGCATDEEMAEFKKSLLEDWESGKLHDTPPAEPQTIFMNLTYIGMLGLDVVDMEILINTATSIGWIDRRVAWADRCEQATKDGHKDDASCELEYIYVKDELLYVPRIVIYNNVDGPEVVFGNLGEFELTVYRDGNIVLRGGKQYNVLCPIVIQDFPFDSQNCSILLVPQSIDPSLGSDQQQLLLKQQNVNFIGFGKDQFGLIENNEWEMTGYQIGSAYQGVFVALQYKRLAYHKLYYLLVPATVLSMLSVFQAGVHLDQGERTIYGITCLLSMSVYLTMLMNYLPPSNNKLPLLGRYFLIQALLSAIHLAETIVLTRYLEAYAEEEPLVEEGGEKHEGHKEEAEHGEHKEADAPSATLIHVAELCALLNFDRKIYKMLKERRQYIESGGADFSHPSAHTNAANTQQPHQVASTHPSVIHLSKRRICHYMVETIDYLLGKLLLFLFLFITCQTFLGQLA